MTDSSSCPAVKVTVVTPQPLISVIIAVHNEAPYIIDTLRSVARSDYNNIELIIVNDRSVDGSDALIAKHLNELAQPETSIKKCLLLSKVCNNKFLALGVGMAHAQGAIVVTLDADMQLKPHNLSRLAKTYNPHSGTILFQHIGSRTSGSRVPLRDRLYRVPQPVSRMVHRAYMRVGMRSSK
jgi:glycosyltransferase involved in cell wall biosynthesis